MRKILAKLLFCSEYDLNNVLLHLPLGAVIIGLGVGLDVVGLPFVSAGLIVAFTFGFIMYELSERSILHDKAFPDIQGYLWGVGLAAFIAILALGI